MNSTVKKVLWGSLGALVIASIVGFQKVTKIKSIFDKMDILPDRISKFDFNLSLQKIRFNLDVKLVNNSMDDLFVTGASFATLKQVIIFYKDTYLATANVNLNSIQIPKKGSFVLQNIPVEVDAINVLQNITSLVNFDVAKMGITGIITALGNDYEIGAE